MIRHVARILFLEEEKFLRRRREEGKTNFPMFQFNLLNVGKVSQFPMKLIERFERPTKAIQNEKSIEGLLNTIPT